MKKGTALWGDPQIYMYCFTQTLTAIASGKLSLSKDILLTALFTVLWPTQDVFAETKCV